MKNFYTLLQDNRLTIIILFLFIIFIFVYSLLAYATPEKFTSPDEDVNLFFIEHYAQTGSLSYYEPLNKITLGYTRPRNTITGLNDNVAPGGFTGFYIIYGAIGALIPQIIPYITPLLAGIGGLFIFIIGSTIFNRKIGLLSMILLFLLPPYWYWGSVSLFNNMAATVFLMGGLTFLLLVVETGELGYYIAAAFCFGLNHSLRLTDVTYFIPIAYLLCPMRKKINIKYLFIAFFVYLFTVLPIFISNKILFGNFLAFGYNPTLGTGASSPLLALYQKISFFLLPSGLYLNNMLFSFFTYCLGLTPLVFVFGLIGIFKYKEYKKTIARSYFVVYTLLFIWILAYYGSGYFWGLSGFTLDSSYIRYFLPIYVFIIPLVAKVLLSLPKKLSILSIFVLVITSLINVYKLSNGLDDMQKRRLDAQTASNEILQTTEKNAVIITTLSDKDIFPDRKIVAYGPVFKEFTYPTLLTIIGNLSSHNLPVYVYNDREDLDVNRVEKLLAQKKLTMNESNTIIDLYKVTKK